jgi:regulator of extracellular matrix RemA (YlzA/DUF370 family)
MDSDHIVLCSVQTETISQRMLALQTGHHLADLVTAQKIKVAG